MFEVIPTEDRPGQPAGHSPATLDAVGVEIVRGRYAFRLEVEELGDEDPLAVELEVWAGTNMGRDAWARVASFAVTGAGQYLATADVTPFLSDPGRSYTHARVRWSCRARSRFGVHAGPVGA